MQNVEVVLTKWKNVLTSYLSDMDDQVHLSVLSPILVEVIHVLLCNVS